MHEIKFYTYGRCTITDRWRISPTNIVNRIYYVYKPSAKYCYKGITKVMKVGHLYIFPCSTALALSNENHAPFDHLYFDFITNPPLVLDDVFELDVSKHSAIGSNLSAVDAIFSEFKKNTDGIDNVIMRYFENLLFLLDKIHPLFATADKRILASLEFIHKNYTNPIDVDTLARIACMEKTYFIKIFGQNMKMTPYKYIKKCRIAHGISLIRQGVSITDASRLCGYGSVSSFSNMIKKDVGIYPSKILEQI